MPRTMRFVVWAALIGVAAIAWGDACDARGPGWSVSARWSSGPSYYHHHEHFVRPSVVHVERSPLAAAIDAAAVITRELIAPPPNSVHVIHHGVHYYRSGDVYYRPVYRYGRTVYIVSAPPLEVVTPMVQYVTPPSVTVVAPPALRPASAPSPEYSAYPRFETPAELEASGWTAPPSASVVNGVARPAVGRVVEALPAGAVSRTINGAGYFEAAGVFYLPIVDGGRVRYVVVQRPGGE